MGDTATEVQMAWMNRIKDLAESNPDVYRHAFAWVAGAGSVNEELGKHVEKAIDYVERTYPR